MKKILIVEDDKTNAEILEFHVKGYFKECNVENIKVDTASNGYEAFGMHYNYHYDIILLDVKMPKCDGLKFLNILRNDEVVHQPLVSMVTGMGDAGFINLYKQKGANSFLIKPYEKDKVYLILEHSFNLKANDNTDESFDDEFDFDFDFDEDEDEKISVEDKKTLEDANNTHIKVSAQEFLEEFDNIDYILEDLEDLDLILDLLITNLDMDTLLTSMDKIDECLRKYATFLNSLSSFGELSSTLTSINNQLANTDFSVIKEKKMSYIVEFIRSILEDLQNWKDFVFVQKTAHDVYYINASIISNNIQLQHLIKRN